MRWLTLSALAALAALSALNWRAQLQTQQKLDSLSATLAERPAPAAEPVQVTVPPPGAPPRELSHVTLPPYVIEAPDQLRIEVVVKDPKTGATDRLPVQPISGPFLVRPDGTVGLGVWGNVFVAGLTLERAAKAVREQVVKGRPELSTETVAALVDVLAYNSKVYYVIIDGSGGEQVVRLPITGSETVMDAIANIGGLAGAASKGKIWVSRPAGQSGQPAQTLPVDWRAITQQGVTQTNYQLLPGDRVYVKQTAD